MKKLIITLILISLATAIAFALTLNHAEPQLDMVTRQQYINRLNSEVEQIRYNVTKQDIRAMLESELDFMDYTYKEVDIPNGGYAGKLSKIIEINKDLDIETYCFVLCHEMCHLKYDTSDEIYTNFMAFKTLYESDNEMLRNVGTWFGIYFLNGDYDREYDCSKLIVNYLHNLIDKN